MDNKGMRDVNSNKLTLCSSSRDEYFLKNESGFKQLKYINGKRRYSDNYELDIVDADNILLMELPKIDFCESKSNMFNDESSVKVNDFPQIPDLCESDREKIGNLIAEVVRYKELCRGKNEEVQKLLDENNQKMEKIIQLEQDLSAFKLGCKAKDSDLKFLLNAHKIQENALKKQILDFQRVIMSMTKDKLNLEIELQKLNKQNEYLTKQNKSLFNSKEEIQKKYILLKDRFRISMKVIDAKDDKHTINAREDFKTTLKPILKNVKSNNDLETMCSIQPPRLSESIIKNTINMPKESKNSLKPIDVKYVIEPKCNEDSFQSSEKQEVVTAEKHEITSFNNNALISELFFLPSQQQLSDLQWCLNVFNQ